MVHFQTWELPCGGSCLGMEVAKVVWGVVRVLLMGRHVVRQTRPRVNRANWPWAFTLQGVPQFRETPCLSQRRVQPTVAQEIADEGQMGQSRVLRI